MPFKGTLIGRMLRIFGLSGTKIIAFVDSNGVPRIDFYTGDPLEDTPASIFPAIIVPGTFALILQAPKSTLIGEPPSELILGSVNTQLIAYNQGAIVSMVHDFSGNYVRVGNAASGGVSINGSTGGIQVNGNVNLIGGDGISFIGAGRLKSVNGGSVQAQPANASGGRLVSHGLGVKPTVYGAFTQEANSTFRAVNDDATTDSNDLSFIFRNTQNNAPIGVGTNVSFRWFAMVFA